jgi:hypothetical protein
MTRLIFPVSSWLRRGTVLALALWCGHAQAQTNPRFVLTFGPATLIAGEGNGRGCNLPTCEMVPAITIDPFDGMHKNGLPTVTLPGNASSASVTVNVIDPGNSGNPQHYQIVQTAQGTDVAQSLVSFSAFPSTRTSISVRSVLSVTADLGPKGDAGGPDLASTGIVGAFSDGTRLNTCTTTPSGINGNTSPPCVLVFLNGPAATLKSITRSAVTGVSGNIPLISFYGLSYTATLTTDIVLIDCPVAGDSSDLVMQHAEIDFAGFECPSKGPQTTFAPKWGPFGRKAALDSTKGEQLTLECGSRNDPTEFQFLLEYTKDKSASPPVTHPVGACVWPHGCNSALFSYMLDKGNPGQPACFVRTRWISRDYGANTVDPIPGSNPTAYQNPYTKRAESPTIGYAFRNNLPSPILDWVQSDYDVLVDNFAMTDLMFHYADGGPPTPLCSPSVPPQESPPPPPLQPFDQKALPDPPLGPETDAIFDNVFSVLHGKPGVSEGSGRSLADLNYDGKVDAADLNVLQHALGSCFGQPNYDFNADLDGDGCVTDQDLQIWMSLSRAHFKTLRKVIMKQAI